MFLKMTDTLVTDTLVTDTLALLRKQYAASAYNLRIIDSDPVADSDAIAGLHIIIQTLYTVIKSKEQRFYFNTWAKLKGTCRYGSCPGKLRATIDDAILAKVKVTGISVETCTDFTGVVQYRFSLPVADLDCLCARMIFYNLYEKASRGVCVYITFRHVVVYGDASVFDAKINDAVLKQVADAGILVETFVDFDGNIQYRFSFDPNLQNS